jgi:type IV fimbrial biogenesis protein FimT
VAILLFLAVPSFTTWIRNAQMRSVADAVQNGIRSAQSEAVRRNRQVVFMLTNDEPSVARAATAPAANGANWSIRTIPLMVGGTENSEYVEGGSFADVARGASIEGVAAICFNSQGRLVANADPTVGCSATAAVYNVTQTGAERRMRITVSVGGQMRMCDPDKSIADAPDGC